VCEFRVKLFEVLEKIMGMGVRDVFWLVLMFVLCVMIGY